MVQKKDVSKFTIQFNPADPQHAQVIDILNRQGRRKAQFITNTIMHYLHCSNTPDIPQAAPVDTAAIEVIVRRIIEERSKADAVSAKEALPEPSVRRTPKTESIQYDEAAELLGKDGMAAIANTMAMFRK